MASTPVLPAVRWLIITFGLIFSLAGCRPEQVREAQATATPSPTVTPTAEVVSVAVATEVTTETPVAAETPVATATLIIAETTPAPATPLPTETPPPLHPLMIDTMRQQSYPASEIVFEETLEPGANYDRYIVSYLSEGYKIFALFTFPHGEPPEIGWPVIIFNHGYIPPTQYRTTERYVAYVDALAQQGYIVFRSDYRGHGNSGGEALGGYGSPAYTVDVLNAVATMRAFPGADPNRIGMWGHSMGGHITLRAMVTSGDIKAGVIWAGVVASYPDLLERWRRPNGGIFPTPDPNSRRGRWRRELLDTYGAPADNPDFWSAISPITYINDLSGPIQLHHGTADRSVPAEFSETLFNLSQNAGLPTELYLYQGDDHNISANFSTAMARSIQFFDTHVKAQTTP